MRPRGLDLGPLPRAARARRSGRCSRRGSSSGSSSSPSGGPTGRDARLRATSTPAGRGAPRPCSTGGPKPVRRARRPGGPAGPPAAAARPPRRRPDRPRLDAPRGRRRAALRPDRASRVAGPAAIADGDRPAGPAALGPRQRAALDDLVAAGAAGVPARSSRARHGDVGPRQPRPARPRRDRGDARRPAGRSPPGPRAAAGRGPAAPRSAPSRRRPWPRSRAAIRDRDATPLAPRRRHRRRQDRDLRRGARRVRSTPGARRSCSCPRSPSPCRSSTGCGPTWTPRSPSSTRGLGDGERADEWRRIRAGDVDVVVGTRLAVARPARRDVGLIVVDEEHDPAYKSDRTPRLQARDVAHPARRAGRRARSSSARRRRRSRPRAGPATGPTAASACRTGSAGRRRRSRSSTSGRSSRPATGGCSRGRSSAALAALDREAGDQAILVINRRGTASVVLCRDCGHVQACPECTRPLVYHQAGIDAALPPLRPGHAARVALPGVRLGADPLPRRRHGAARARGPRPLPGAARRAPRPRRRRAPRRRGPRRRCLHRRARSTSSSGRASSRRASTSRR